jgi:hypothetical protein
MWVLWVIILIVVLLLFYLEFLAEERIELGFLTLRHKNGIEKRYQHHHLQIFGWGNQENYGEVQLGIHGSIKTEKKDIYQKIKHLLGESEIREKEGHFIISFNKEGLKFETNEFKAFLRELNALLSSSD